MRTWRGRPLGFDHLVALQNAFDPHLAVAQVANPSFFIDSYALGKSQSVPGSGRFGCTFGHGFLLRATVEHLADTLRQNPTVRPVEFAIPNGLHVIFKTAGEYRRWGWVVGFRG